MASIDIAGGRHRDRRHSAGARSVAPLAGVAFVVLIAAAFVVAGDSPDEKAKAAEIVSYYKDHEAVSVIAAVLASISVPFGVVFGAAARETLGRSGDRAAARWGDVALGGSVLAAVGILVGGLTSFALADGADNGIATPAMQALNHLGVFSWLMFVPGFGTLGIALGAGILASGVTARWVGWMALALGIACFVPVVSFVAFILAIVWIPIVSIRLSSATA